MKNAVIILLFVVLDFPVAAQAQPAAKPLVSSIDSLQKLVNAHPAEDTTKVNLLNSLARFCLYDTQIKRGIINAQVARQLAQKINYAKGEGLYLRVLAVLNKKSPLNFKYYYDTETRWFYERIHEKETLDASEYFQESAQDLNKLNTELFATLNYAQKQQDKEMTAILFYLIGGTYITAEKYEDCLVYVDKALQLFQEINKPSPVFYVMVSRMALLERLKRPNEAAKVEAELIRMIAQTQNIKEKADFCYNLGGTYMFTIQNHSALGIEYLFKANTMLEQVGDTQLRVEVLAEIGYAFNALLMYNKAIPYYKKAEQLLGSIKNYPVSAYYIFMNLSYNHVKLKQFTEAAPYIRKANELAEKWGFKNSYFKYEIQGEILMYKGHYKEAIPYFHLSNEAFNVSTNSQGGHQFVNLYLGQCYLAVGNFKESIAYGNKAYARAINGQNRKELHIKTCLLLTEAYEKSGQPLLAYKYLKEYKDIIKGNEEEGLSERSSTAEIEGIIQKSEQEKAALEREKLIKEAENQNQRWWLITAFGILLSAVGLVVVLYRNNKNKQKANVQLHRQKEEINEQRTKAENALTDLKATQAQLIQKEKLVSLGELTAGIAHEIQNPLNFVNNFSELSNELIDEMNEELAKGDTEEAKAIAGDLKQNLQKINHHGKRASSIVKGMLEHSKTSSGKKERTDLNALTDEYLRLAYHGMRAKDKDFNADYKSDFDATLPKIEVQPQDMGRVLLNLMNNAFYAVNVAQTINPWVQVSTKKLADSIEIRVKDNGTGIQEGVKAKIFQPFFTTKPTGEGTGLGLSLAYDIVTKGHGGTLEVESVEGEGTEFIIRLPINE